MKITTTMPMGFTKLIGFSVLNFLLFVLIFILVGGEALPFKAENGKYLMWGHGGGTPPGSPKHYFEISRNLYYYIIGHATFSVLLLITVFLKDIITGVFKPRA